MQAVPRALRVAGIVEDLDGGGGAELRPVLQYPDDFLIRSYFNELRTLVFSAARADDGIAICETGSLHGAIHSGADAIEPSGRQANGFSVRFVSQRTLYETPFLLDTPAYSPSASLYCLVGRSQS